MKNNGLSCKFRKEPNDKHNASVATIKVNTKCFIKQCSYIIKVEFINSLIQWSWKNQVRKVTSKKFASREIIAVKTASRSTKHNASVATIKMHTK